MSPATWSLPRRAAFQFFFCYFMLFFLTDRLVDLIPGSGAFLRSYGALTWRLLSFIAVGSCYGPDLHNSLSGRVFMKF